MYEGKTTGTPICLLIKNTDQRSKDYGNILETFRPGHADYAYLHKYGLRDPRGGGRSSARLTAPTVAAGTWAAAIRSIWMSASHKSMPGGQPSITQPMAGPWDSPKLVTANKFPKVLPLMIYLLF